MLSEHSNEDEEMGRCKSAVHHVKKMEKDVDVALTKGKMAVWLIVSSTLYKTLEKEQQLMGKSKSHGVKVLRKYFNLVSDEKLFNSKSDECCKICIMSVW